MEYRRDKDYNIFPLSEEGDSRIEFKNDRFYFHSHKDGSKPIQVGKKEINRLCELLEVLQDEASDWMKNVSEKEEKERKKSTLKRNDSDNSDSDSNNDDVDDDKVDKKKLKKKKRNYDNDEDCRSRSSEDENNMDQKKKKDFEYDRS